MTLSPARVSTNSFQWDADRRMFSTEISDLGREFNFGQVYDDACDEGLTLIGARTGEAVTCTVTHVERDREGDLLYWGSAPAREQVLPGAHLQRLGSTFHHLGARRAVTLAV
jgi:hypothetical protein